MSEDVIPLNTPLPNGDTSIRVSPGQFISMPVRDGLNVDPLIWGDDALEFKWASSVARPDATLANVAMNLDTRRPERWANPPEAVSSIPGVWGHLLTFLGGPHACIGYRFSVIECVQVMSRVMHLC